MVLVSAGTSCPTSEVSSLMDSEEMDHQIESTKYMDGGLVQARMKELMEEEMQIDQLEHASSKSLDDQEIKIDQQNPSKKASQHHDLEDLMNKLIMIHEKRNTGQKPTLFERSNSLDHKRMINPRSEEPVIHRTRNFFKRRSKSHECISFNDNDTPLPSNVTNGFRVHHERSISQFSFTEIKKKLKNVIAKSSRDSGCLEKPVVEGNSGWSSPNRDHFCSERFSRISYAFKQDVSSRLCKSERHLSGVKEIGDTNDRVSNIYTEAKKHLYDLLSKEDEETELIVESHSRTLGNLLSFPDDDYQEPNVSDEVHQTEGVVEMLKPLSPEEVEVSDAMVTKNVSDHEDFLIISASFKKLKLDLSEEDVLSCSPTVSPSRSLLVSDGKNEEVEITSDGKTSKPSPVSVLEPLFSDDDDISPARSVSRSAESSIQLRRIQFKETVTPTENQETCIFGHTDEESVYEYVEAVLLASDLNWNEFEQRWLSSAQILDHSLYDELQIFSSRARHDQLLLFDTTNEILNEVCDCLIDFFPTFSNCKPSTHQLPKGIDLINLVWERIESRINCHHPRSLDELIKKDFEVSRTWIDLRLETREIAMEIEELMLEDMIDATVLSLLYA
ncbi:hypothetical protein R6Q57_015494 [Mikania cordata]